MTISVEATHWLTIDFVVFLVFLSILLEGTVAHGYKRPVENGWIGTACHCSSGSILELPNTHVLQPLVVGGFS